MLKLFPGKVNALGGLEVRGDFSVPNNAYITTLQVNQTSYLKNTEIDGTLKINNVDTNTLYQTRAWVSLKVSYNASNQTPITVYQYGRATAEVSTANTNTTWFITFPAHPAGDNYVSQYCIVGEYGLIFHGFQNSTSIAIYTRGLTAENRLISFNLTIF